MANEYIITGEHADGIADMIAFMAHYVSGPGFTGFVTWTREQYSANPELQDQINEENIKTNLAELSWVISMLVREGKSQ